MDHPNGRVGLVAVAAVLSGLQSAEGMAVIVYYLACIRPCSRVRRSSSPPIHRA